MHRFAFVWVDACLCSIQMSALQYTKFLRLLKPLELPLDCVADKRWKKAAKQWPAFTYFFGGMGFYSRSISCLRKIFDWHLAEITKYVSYVSSACMYGVGILSHIPRRMGWSEPGNVIQSWPYACVCVECFLYLLLPWNEIQKIRDNFDQETSLPDEFGYPMRT